MPRRVRAPQNALAGSGVESGAVRGNGCAVAFNAVTAGTDGAIGGVFSGRPKAQPSVARIAASGNNQR